MKNMQAFQAAQEAEGDIRDDMRRVAKLAAYSSIGRSALDMADDAMLKENDRKSTCTYDKTVQASIRKNMLGATVLDEGGMMMSGEDECEDDGINMAIGDQTTVNHNHYYNPEPQPQPDPQPDQPVFTSPPPEPETPRPEPEASRPETPRPEPAGPDDSTVVFRSKAPSFKTIGTILGAVLLGGFLVWVGMGGLSAKEKETQPTPDVVYEVQVLPSIDPEDVSDEE